MHFFFFFFFFGGGGERERERGGGGGFRIPQPTAREHFQAKKAILFALPKHVPWTFAVKSMTMKN